MPAPRTHSDSVALFSSPLPIRETIMSQAVIAIRSVSNMEVRSMPRHVSCNDCSLSPICLPLAVAPSQLDELDGIIRRGRPLKRGEHLFRAAAPFSAVYAVRSGALKTY